MERRTVRWATAAAIAAVLLAAWFLLRRTAGTSPQVSGNSRQSDAPRADPPASPPAARAAPAEFPDPEGHVPAAPPPPPAAAPQTPPQRMVVLEGKVVGLGDEPVAGATVCLLLGEVSFDTARGLFHVEVAQGRFLPDPSGPAGADDIFELMGDETQAGEDGTFRFETPARVRVGLIAWGGAYANTIVPPFSLEEDVRGLVLRMEPAVALSGRVMEAALPDLGHPPGPIANATVSLLQRGSGGRRIHLRAERTGEDGTFRTWGWTPGVYEVDVEAPGFLGKRGQEVRLPLDGLDLRLAPARACALTGDVRLPGGAEPAAGVRVRARLTLPAGNWVEDWRSADTGPDGRYRIEGFPVSTTPAKGALMVEADAGERGVGKTVLMSWSGNDEADIDLLPAPGAVLRVRVIDGTRGSGRVPAAGVRVCARGSVDAPSSAQWPIPVERTATTDAAGTAEFRGLPRRGVLISLADDEWTWEIERAQPRGAGDAPEEGAWELEIDVLRRGRVRGIVTAPGGGPVAGALVEVLDDPARRIAPAAARTGADGRFTLDAVSGQLPFRLRASAHGHEPHDTGRLSVSPGASLDDVLLPLPTALESILGRVVDERGNPRPEVHVEARTVPSGAAPGAGAFTGTGGRYRLEVQAGFRWQVFVATDGFDETPSEPVRPGEPVPDLVLRPADEEK